MFHRILDQFISHQNDGTFYFALLTLYFFCFNFAIPYIIQLHLAVANHSFYL